MEEIVVTCKYCGHKQTHLRNPDSPGRVTCNNCGKVIVSKPRGENKPKEKPIWLSNKYQTRCKRCKKVVAIQAHIAWIPGRKGILCELCAIRLGY